jgi:quercetin dioxygenase-like cupin family protein
MTKKTLYTEVEYREGYFEELLAQGRTEEVDAKVREEGFAPVIIKDPAGQVYPPHTHATTKYLAFLEGSMGVTAAGEEFDCRVGDVMIIPGGVTHGAVVGTNGCVFLWSEILVTGNR